MTEDSNALPRELETVPVFRQLVGASDQLLTGADDYKTWCERALSTSLRYVEAITAGVLIVPQVGKGAGLPVRTVVKPTMAIDRQVVDGMVSEYWRRPTKETIVLEMPNFSLQPELAFIVAPIALWFDPPIGFFWAVSPKSTIKPVQVCLEYASHLVAQAVRMTKSVHTLGLLSQSIWSEQANLRTKAHHAALGCLQALCCSAVIAWEVNHKVTPHVLRTLVAVGDVPTGLQVDMQLGVGAAGTAALDNKVIIVGDLLDDNELSSKGIAAIRNRDVVLKKKWRSAVFVPVDIGGQVAAVLAAYGERVRAFSDLDKDIVLAFAQRLAAGYTHVARIEQLTEMERRLELESAAIDTGILAMEHVHDAYNSLGISQAYIGLIRDEFKRLPESNVYKYSQTVSKSIDHALKLIKILRDGADITKVKFSNNKLAKTIDDVVEQLKENAQREKITIRSFCPDDLRFSYDKWQIARVFKNFIENSLYFLQGIPRRDLQTEIRATLEPNFVKISFWDNGPGISTEDMPHIFDYFFTRKGEPRGMGFGLAIAKRIVEKNHGGRIEVRSRWGEETEFVVYLPYRN